MFLNPSREDRDTQNCDFLEQPNFANQATQPSMFELLKGVLDEVDCGILLVTETARVRYANRSARRSLLKASAFCVTNEIFCLRNPSGNLELREALRACQTGKRAMFSARNSCGNEGSVAVVPIHLPADNDVVALLTLGKCQSFNELSLQFFGKTHKLTFTETRILQGLCLGWPCKDIASQGGIALSTVRTHVRSIIQKTEARGIRGIVGMVNAMAPIAAAV